MAAKIENHLGDLLSVEHGIIVHGCNAQGVMGSGVALAVKNKYPIAFEEYRKAYLRKQLRVGHIFPVLIDSEDNKPKLVLVNAITQEFFGTDRRHVDYDGLTRCFEHVAKFAFNTGMRDIHFPLIGCGYGGGKWKRVAPIIEETLHGLNAHLWLDARNAHLA